MIGLQKAYDMINLDFLFEILWLRGFNNTCIRRIRMLVLFGEGGGGGSISIMTNGEESNTFKTEI
jgi:hypothetical protein